MKRSALRRLTPLTRTGTLRRSPMRRTRRHATIPASVVAFVRIRSGNQCEARAALPTLACSGWLQFHHVLRRSQGGRHTVENLAHVCSSHHRWIHDNPKRATELGLLASRSGERS